MNFVNALRGMRNPLESYHLSDTYYGFAPELPDHIYEERTNRQEYKILSRDNYLGYDDPIVDSGRTIEESEKDIKCEIVTRRLQRSNSSD